MRQLLGNVRSRDQRSRRTVWKIIAVQAVLLAAAIASGYWWLYPVMWVAPYLTVWRVINRLRSIAEHGGMQRSKDRRQTTHSVRQHAFARFFLVPYNIGWHLAHHVDSGVPVPQPAPLPRGTARGRIRRRFLRIPLVSGDLAGIASRSGAAPTECLRPPRRGPETLR